MRKKALSVIMPYVSHGKGKCRPHDGMALPNVRSIYKKIWIETDELIRRKFFFYVFRTRRLVHNAKLPSSVEPLPET